MGTVKQNKANKSNAGKSTGPKTEAGKTTAALNAIKHGLTMSPAVARVEHWLQVILNDKHATVADLGDDAASQASLALAQAETRLERAEAAEMRVAADLAKYAKTHNEPDPLQLDLLDLEDPTVLRWLLKGKMNDAVDDYPWEDTMSIMIAANTNTIPKLSAKLDRIQRYLRQAERQKAKALRAWQQAKKQPV